MRSPPSPSNNRLRPAWFGLAGLTWVVGAQAADQPAPRKYASFQPMDPALLPARAEVPDVAGLPRVLLIGHAISIGYPRSVRAPLAGRVAACIQAALPESRATSRPWSGATYRPKPRGPGAASDHVRQNT